MLIHICCSVDSHYFLQKIQEDYPNEELIGFFYDPNIHPYSEYQLRLFDVQHSCNILGIKLVEGEYDLNRWLELVKGLENEPEKGDRCTVCFDRRLEVSVKKAIELNHNKFTTTLLMSPKKSQEKLQNIGDKLAKQYNCEFIFKDYRAKNGMQLQGQTVKENNLYRQNYCGCLFGLTAQREQQNKLMSEMISPITKQILPESIEQRLELYKKRNELKEKNINFKIVKNKILNYRILSGKISFSKQIVPSYFLAYSTLQNKKTSAKIDFIQDNIYYLNKDSVRIIELQTFNNLSNKNYKNIYQLIKEPLSFEDELKVRLKIILNSYDLSTIIIVDKILDGKIEINLDSLIFSAESASIRKI